MRRWHLWSGVFAALFLIVFAFTGTVLNYKAPIFGALGLEPTSVFEKAPSKELGARPETTAATLFSTAQGFSAAAVSADRVLELARVAWGEVPLERIELKAEHDGLVWKVKEKRGAELIVNAVTGDQFVKGAYERVTRTSKDGQMSRSTDWSKLLIDLHTGKIGGEIGKAVMTVAAGVLLFLTLSGLYLWLKPVLIRNANARARATPTPSTSTRPATTAAAVQVSVNG